MFSITQEDHFMAALDLFEFCITVMKCLEVQCFDLSGG